MEVARSVPDGGRSRCTALLAWHVGCSWTGVVTTAKVVRWPIRPATVIAAAAIALWVSPARGEAAASQALLGPPGTQAADCRALEPGAAAPMVESADVSRAERDELTAIATARYVGGDLEGALDAWNQMSEPRVRCVNVEGLVRMRRTAIIEYLGIESGEVFTAESLARMNRRLGELSFASSTRARFDPSPGGTTTITPIVMERGVLPDGVTGWGGVGIRVAFRQEVRVRLVSPSGNGEVWTPSYKWSENRPRAMLKFEAPAPGRLPGMVSMLGLAERQTYGDPLLGGDFRQSRQRVGAAMSDWVTSWLRWQAGPAYDRIGGVSHAALEGSLNARALGDRLAVIASAGYWLGEAGHTFGKGELVATVRSTATQDVPVVTTWAGVAGVGDTAKLAVWPAASSSESRGALLRAHPLRSDGVITGEAFGRTLVFATAEYEHPFHTKFGTVALAGFVDTAQALRRLDGSDSTFHVDIGTGVRLNALGAGGIRIDFAYGLRDGRTRLSFGYLVPWGTR